jgi:hypothetical protein
MQSLYLLHLPDLRHRNDHFDANHFKSNQLRRIAKLDIRHMEAHDAPGHGEEGSVHLVPVRLGMRSRIGVRYQLVAFMLAEEIIC